MTAWRRSQRPIGPWDIQAQEEQRVEVAQRKAAERAIPPKNRFRLRVGPITQGAKGHYVEHAERYDRLTVESGPDKGEWVYVAQGTWFPLERWLAGEDGPRLITPDREQARPIITPSAHPVDRAAMHEQRNAEIRAARQQRGSIAQHVSTGIKNLLNGRAPQTFTLATGEPLNGRKGTLAGTAQSGDVLTIVATGARYTNVGTLRSPRWEGQQ